MILSTFLPPDQNISLQVNGFIVKKTSYIASFLGYLNYRRVFKRFKKS